MKVCKKCKKKVANKSKLCRYCGADVSKCKIIKNSSSKSKKSNVNKKQDNVIKQSSNKIEKKEINFNEITDLKVSKVKQSLEKDNNIDVVKKERKINIKFDFFKNKKNKVKDKKKSKRFNGVVKFSICLGILSFLIIGSYVVVGVFNLSYVVQKKEVIVKEDATGDKVFAMGDIITYNGVDYRVDSATVSKENGYKKPDDGNQFLIVTVSIFNNTDNEVDYSYKNWIMSNSTNDDVKSIFSSINTGTALYTGKLKHGVKTGTMVFEQPIKDKKLRISFYELKENKDGISEIDKEKKIFTVSIKIDEEDKKANLLDANVKKDSTKNLD